MEKCIASGGAAGQGRGRYGVSGGSGWCIRRPEVALDQEVV